jgi:hypothetical protein
LASGPELGFKSGHDDPLVLPDHRHPKLGRGPLGSNVPRGLGIPPSELAHGLYLRRREAAALQKHNFVTLLFDLLIPAHEER